MKYSELDETLIFEAKRAFDKIIAFDFGLILNKETLKDYIPTPDLELVKNQIIQNLQNNKHPDLYIKQLEQKFKNAFELIEILREEKYKLQNELEELESLPKDFGLELDYNAKTEKYFFGDKYRESAIFDHSYNLGHGFKEVALSYYFYTKDIRPEQDEMDAFNLLERYNFECKTIRGLIFNIDKLLPLAETIQETIHDAEQQIKIIELPIADSNKVNLLQINAVETNKKNLDELEENYIFEVKRALDKFLNNWTLIVMPVIYPPIPNIKLVNEQIIKNIEDCIQPLEYIKLLKKRFPNNQKLMEEWVEMKYGYVNEQQEMKEMTRFLTYDPKNDYYFKGKDYYEKDPDGIHFKEHAMDYFFHSKNISVGTVEKYEREDEYLLGRFNHEYGVSKLSLETITKYIDLVKTISETVQLAEQTLKKQLSTVEMLEVKEVSKTNNKLKFNNKKGNKASLYYVLRQLYEKGIIESSWPEIAEFLIENVTGFENSNSKNLTDELSRKTDPMPQRKIDIPKNLPELDE